MPAGMILWLAFGLLIWVITRALRRPPPGPWWDRYNEYLQSPEWKEKRRECYERAGGICEVCGQPIVGKRFQAHHRPGTYRRQGQELPGDLLCTHYGCHRRLHPGKRF